MKITISIACLMLALVSCSHNESNLEESEKAPSPEHKKCEGFVDSNQCYSVLSPESLAEVKKNLTLIQKDTLLTGTEADQMRKMAVVIESPELDTVKARKELIPFCKSLEAIRGRRENGEETDLAKYESLLTVESHVCRSSYIAPLPDLKP